MRLVEKKLDNTVTKFRWADSADFITREAVHWGWMTDVESEIPGIQKEVHGGTDCPRCRSGLNPVPYMHKTQCPQCGLWMAAIKDESVSILGGYIAGTLLIWDESVRRAPPTPGIPQAEKQNAGGFWKWLWGK
jgi:hypothetical protein